MPGILIIGHGAIAGAVIARLRAGEDAGSITVLCRPGRVPAARAVLGDAIPVIDDIETLPAGIDLAVDCAGHQALAAHGPALLARGIDLLTVSVGALADPGLVARLDEAARAGGASLHLLPGAIGGIDALAAAQVGGLDRVVYRGRKPPLGWIGSPAETQLDLQTLAAPACHFRGSAREAASLYPKNANVAATVALAGLGLDATRVELIADPGVTRNVHEIEAEGAFGRLHLILEGNPLPDNPKSSALTAMSVVRAVRNRRRAIVI